MNIDVTVKIGGEAGQGIQTVGEILAVVCQKAGLYLHAINDFESRIRGGHSFFQIRISSKPVSAPHKSVHLLVAMNERTFDLHKNELAAGGLAILNQKIVSEKENSLAIPMEELAKAAGGKILSNTVAAGACLALLGAPFDLFETIIKEQFSQKGDKVIQENLDAGKHGYTHVRDAAFKWAFLWQKEHPKGVLLNGSKALALGALAGDCRFAAFYPMSPATSIMANLTELSDTFPLVIEQAEDEIAAVNMIIGASFAGVRAMTATSGGGFCLMTEGLGLAGITETPIVIINAQRPGPATGLPTRTGQGDLQFVIHAAQDEFPRFVFAPGNPDEAFDAAARAFYFSEKYQVPAIILSDQLLNDSLYLTEKPLHAPQEVERFIISDADMKNPSGYKRYEVTESGISPRALPCMGKALVIHSGNEHREDGHTSEAISDRISMVNKRNSKLTGMLAEMRSPETYYENSDVLLVGWGSTKGTIREAVDMVRGEGMSVGCLHIMDVWPFPADAVSRILGDKPFLTVEQNSTAQMGQLVREQTGLKYSGAVLKYDGRPFYPEEIAKEIKCLKF